VLFLVTALVAIAGMVFEIRSEITGDYARSGGGRWYYGAQIMQLQPDEACTYAGFTPLHPWRVETNEYGTLMSVCYDQVNARLTGVPVVVTAKVNR